MSSFAISIAAAEVSAIIYAPTRGDIQRIATVSMLAGMNFYMTSIPIEYPAPKSSTAFEIPALVGMFNEGYKIANKDWEWRTEPPNRKPGENANERAGTTLTYKQRGPFTPPGPTGRPITLFPSSDQGIPAVAMAK